MTIQSLIDDRSAQVGIIGLGYVGLPKSVAFARTGFSVTGFDVDDQVISTINQGHSHVTDVPDDSVSECVENGRLSATADMSKLANMDVVLICVPTPLRKSRSPDVSNIVNAAETLENFFDPPGLIVLESTSYPGTTEEIIVDHFQENGVDIGKDIKVAYSPERIDPANEEYGIENTPTVVGGYTAEAGDWAENFYGTVADRVVQVSDTKTAEMVKLLENVFRTVNIGLANEMALICDNLDINTGEVIDAASTKPYGFMPFYPGPGLGGHCIPVDPLFLSWKAKTQDIVPRFIDLADEINRSMPDYVVEKITEGLNEQKKPVNGSDICVFGVSYKGNVSDTRESPAYDVIGALLDRGASVRYVDPYVDEFEVKNQNLERVELDEVDTESDCWLILTDHDDFEWTRREEFSSLVVDTRNAVDKAQLPSGTDLLQL